MKPINQAKNFQGKLQLIKTRTKIQLFNKNNLKKSQYFKLNINCFDLESIQQKRKSQKK